MADAYEKKARQVIKPYWSRNGDVPADVVDAIAQALYDAEEKGFSDGWLARSNSLSGVFPFSRGRHTRKVLLQGPNR